MKYLFYFAASLCSLLFWSCNQESEVVESLVEDESGVRVSVPAFEPEDGSRVNIDIVEATGAVFTWSATDKIGTFSDEGGLLRFDLQASDAGSNVAHFKGAGFSLSPLSQYCAFYPYAAATVDRVPVSYTGQKQVGNNTSSHLGTYDYIYSPFVSTNARGEVIFGMKHMGSLVRFQLTMPAADTYSKLRLQGYYGCRFLHNGYYNLNDPEAGLAWPLAPAQADYFEMDLQDIATTAPGQVITLYAMVAPKDYTAQRWVVEVVGSLKTYKSDFEYVGKNFLPGKSYRVVETMH